MTLRVIKKRLEHYSQTNWGQFLILLTTFSLFYHQCHIYFATSKVKESQEDKISIIEENVDIEEEFKDPKLDKECQCKPLQRKAREDENFICSDFASLNRASENQKIISISHFDHSHNLKEFSETVYALFPGYTLRVYHNVSDPNQHLKLCDLFCTNPHIDLCNTRKIGKYGDSRGFFAPLWKFATLADPTIEEVHFRLDHQVLTKREIAAIQDWKENSEASFIIMRDHPNFHRHLIAGHLLGVKPKENLRKTLREAYEKLMLTSRTMKDAKDLEKVLLEAIIWPIAQ